MSDVFNDGQVSRRATILQQKTRSPVKFEITYRTRRSIEKWIDTAKLSQTQFLFTSRQHSSRHLSLRQYSRISRIVGKKSRTEPGNVRNSFNEKDEGDADLWAN